MTQTFFIVSMDCFHAVLLHYFTAFAKFKLKLFYQLALAKPTLILCLPMHDGAPPSLHWRNFKHNCLLFPIITRWSLHLNSTQVSTTKFSWWTKLPPTGIPGCGHRLTVCPISVNIYEATYQYSFRFMQTSQIYACIYLCKQWGK